MSHDEREAETARMTDALERIRKRGLLPPELLDLLAEVGRLQRAAQADVVVRLPEPGDCAPADAVLQGKPLVGREHFPLDLESGLPLFGRLLALACDAQGPLGEAARDLRGELDDGALSAEVLLGKVTTDREFFDDWGQSRPEAPRTALFLALAALRPGIHAAARELAPRLPETGTWNQPACPICGEPPLISILRQKEGFRHATCSFCGHEYRIRRLACPICNEDDQKKLTFFTVKEEPGFRVDVCKTCNHYIKTIDFRDLDRTPCPEYDDLDSLALDFVAAKQGYRRATLSAWGF